MTKSKVIGIGFHKTGTTTLGNCLRILGYNHISCNREAFLLYHSGEIKALLKLMEYFDSFEDWPWPLIYKEAYERFPESKFILTTRIDEEKWYQSLAKHVDRWSDTHFPYRKYVYGYEDPRENKELHVATYLRHNREVREFFADKPGSFLEVCWEKGHGWKELSGFLGVDPGDNPFPHANKGSPSRPQPEPFARRLAKAVRLLVRG